MIDYVGVALIVGASFCAGLSIGFSFGLYIMREEH